MNSSTWERREFYSQQNDDDSSKRNDVERELKRIRCFNCASWRHQYIHLLHLRYSNPHNIVLDIVENTLLQSNETDAAQTITDSKTFESHPPETLPPQIETNELNADVPKSFPSSAEDNTKPRDVDNALNFASNVLADNDTMSFDLVQRILQMTSRTVDDLDSFIEQNSSVG